MSPAWFAASSERKKQIDKLQAVTTVEQAREAAGRLGVVLQLKNGSWIVISYTDSHTLGLAFSSAVARTSEGRWMTSSHHYCGEFASYRNQRDMYLEWIAGATTQVERDGAASDLARLGESTLLDDVESAVSLDEARLLLLQAGFEPMSTPR